MRVRSVQNYPSAESQIILAKRPESYRIISLFVSATTASVLGNAQCLLSVVDGAGNSLMTFGSPPLVNAIQSNFTFSAADVDTTTSVGVGGVAGGFIMVPLPEELWVQPQWQVQILISPNTAGDVLANANMQIEMFTREKSVASARPTGEDSSP